MRRRARRRLAAARLRQPAACFASIQPSFESRAASTPDWSTRHSSGGEGATLPPPSPAALERPLIAVTDEASSVEDSSESNSKSPASNVAWTDASSTDSCESQAVRAHEARGCRVGDGRRVGGAALCTRVEPFNRSLDVPSDVPGRHTRGIPAAALQWCCARVARGHQHLRMKACEMAFAQQERAVGHGRAANATGVGSSARRMHLQLARVGRAAKRAARHHLRRILPLIEVSGQSETTWPQTLSVILPPSPLAPAQPPRRAPSRVAGGSDPA